MLAVVHDLAEAQVGDIAPNEGFTDAQKRQLEEVQLFSIRNNLEILKHGI
jgi:5'-deoxynucleotidase YfbR-like HD superfamily hydrolase